MSVRYGITRQLLAWDTNGNIAIQGFNGESWFPWKTLATAEPPQEFNLPLVSGVTNNYKSTYRKNQFGEVAVIAALSHATALPAVVATLPAGYRPAIDLTFPAVLRNSSGNVAWTVRVGANGQISIRENFGTATSLYFSASFLAAP